MITSAGRSGGTPRFAVLGLVRGAGRGGVLGLVLLVACVGIVGPLQILASGGLVLALVDPLGEGGTAPLGLGVTGWVVVFAVLLAINEVGGSLLTTVATHVGAKVDRDLRQRVMALSAAPAGVAHLAEPSVRDLMFRAAEVGTSRFTPGGALTGLANKAAQWVQVVLTAALVLPFHWWLATLLLAAQVLLTHTQRHQYLRQMEVLNSQTPAMRRSAYFRDLALRPGPAKEVRVFGLGSWVADRFGAEWLASMTRVWKYRKEGWSAQSIAVVAAGAIALMAFALIGLEAAAGAVGLGSLTVLLRAVHRVASGVPTDNGDLQIAYGTATLPDLTAAEARLAPPRARVRTAAPADVPPAAPATDIVLDGVEFSYPGSAAPVLRGVDLRIVAGRSLAIVGPNGAGKTTLVKLLCRLVEPTAGRVLVDGADLCDLDAQSWQRHVAPVFQDFIRYRLPIRDNVVFGALHRAEDSALLEHVARRAGISDLIEALPSRWDTPLSPDLPGGVDLSGGQWQRVALARALFAVAGGATVLVMDEPTANLDVRAEAEFYDRFFELTGGSTSLVVSHRFASVRRADLICVLDGGRVAELGSHDELVEQQGRYAAMFALQSSRFGAPNAEV